MKSKVILIVSAVCVGVLVWSAIQTGAAEPPKKPTTKPTTRPTEWKLPVGEGNHRIDELTAADDGRLVFFKILHFDKKDMRAGHGPDVKCWMLNTKSGKFTNLGELMNNKVQRNGLVWGPAIPSPDGKHAVIIARPPLGEGPPQNSAYLLTFKNGEIRKLVENSPVIVPAWGREKLYISHLGADKRLSPIKIFDTVGGKSTDLKICGFVAAVDPKGKFFICGCDPDNPTRPITKAEFRKASMVLVTPEGKVLSRLVTVRDMRALPLMSQGGKYVAFSCLKRNKPPQPPKMWIGIWSTNGKVKRTVKERGWPLAVTDRGEVVAMMIGHQGGLPFSVKFFDAAGKSLMLVKEAKAATVSGGRLFYVTPGKQPVIKSMPLPSAKKPTTQPGSATTSEWAGTERHVVSLREARPTFPATAEKGTAEKVI